MPVHRIPGGGRSSVWATPDELSGWLHALPSDVQATLLAEASSETATPDSAAAQLTVREAANADTAAPATRGGGGRLLRRSVAVAAIFLLVALVASALTLWNSAHRAPGHTSTTLRGQYDDDPRARETYMTARFELATRSAASLLAAERGFRELTQSYPDRAAGWSGLADTYLLLREFGSMRDDLAYPQAERAAR